MKKEEKDYQLSCFLGTYSFRAMSLKVLLLTNKTSEVTWVIKKAIVTYTIAL